MRKLFSASISCTYDNESHWAIKNIQPISEANLWWDPKHPEQATLFESSLVLGSDFFKEVTSYPVPIDMDALKSLKKSPMGIDIYCWLTYRMSYLKTTTTIPWGALQVQFGSDYNRTRDFKKYFIDQLKKVSIVYPAVKVEGTSDGLVLRPSKTHIAHK
jgi:hypothetical protein